MPAKPKNLPRGINAVRRQRYGRQVTLYEVRVTYQGRRELVGRFETLGDAKTAKLLADADIVRGAFIPPRVERAVRREQHLAELDSRLHGYKVRDLVDDWLRHIERMGAKQSTIYTYRRRVDRHVLPHFGDVPVEAVTPRMVEDWFNQLEANNGNGVTRGSYMMLAAAFTYATGAARGQSAGFTPIVERSPCQIAGATVHKPVKPANAEAKVLPSTQVRAIAEAMPATQQLTVLLGGFMALRIGEVLGLQRRDIEDDQHPGHASAQLAVRRSLQSRGSGLRLDTPKTAAGERRLPIPAAMRPLVKTHLAEHVGDDPTAPLFPRSRKGADYLHPNTLRKHFKAAIVTANLAIEERNMRAKTAKEPLIPASFVFHGLRHTALTRIGEDGATTEELKAWAGHVDAATVQRYQHATAKRLASLAETMSTRMT